MCLIRSVLFGPQKGGVVQWSRRHRRRCAWGPHVHLGERSWKGGCWGGVLVVLWSKLVVVGGSAGSAGWSGSSGAVGASVGGGWMRPCAASWCMSGGSESSRILRAGLQRS